MTVRTFITELMTVIGILPQGETPNNSEAAAVFSELNIMIDQWNADGLSLFTLNDATYNLQNGVANYTIGSGGTLTGGVRPVRIRNAASIVGGFSFPIKLIPSDEYNQIIEKNESAQAPRELYCDYAFPVANIKVWPVPAGSCQLRLFTWAPLSQFATLDDEMTLPPAYLSGLRFSLMLRVGPAFKAQVDPLLATQAVEARQTIQRYNAETLGIAVNAGQSPAPQQ